MDIIKSKDKVIFAANISTKRIGALLALRPIKYRYLTIKK